MNAIQDQAIARTAGGQIRLALRTAPMATTPFQYWLPRDVLPGWLCQAVIALPFDAPAIDDTLGRRETHNTQRIFVSETNRERYPACAALAEAFQDEATVALLEDLCGTALAGCSTRIEICLDCDGFWLEPHTDIGAKALTLVIYLSQHQDASGWGTDIMDASGQVLGRAPGTFNHGLLFIPGSDTWHGFRKRTISGTRRSLIVNYVRPEWRARQELAFPDQPVIS